MDKQTFTKEGSEAQLFDDQLGALQTLNDHGQLVASISVGGGKTLISMLACEPLGIDPDDVLVLTTAELRDEAVSEWEEYQKMFDVPLVEYVSYTYLSLNPEFLWDKSPKIIVADECHKIGNKGTKRTSGLQDYFREFPDTIFIPMSGSITTDSILDYAHLLDWALGEDCPLPRPGKDKLGYPRLQSIARVMDARPDVPPSGQDYGIVEYILDIEGEDHRSEYCEVLKSTPGIYISEGTAYGGPIEIEPWEPSLPLGLRKKIREVKENKKMPNGMWINFKPLVAEKIKQLGQGFYYHYIYKDCHDRHWRKARREVRELISEIIKKEKRKKLGKITPSMVKNAFKAGLFSAPEWDRWMEFEHVPEPETKTVWETDDIILEAIERAQQAAREFDRSALVWYSHSAVRDRCQKMLDRGKLSCEDVSIAGRGEAPPRGEDRPDVAIVSIQSHGRGLNLQRDYAINVVLVPPANGGTWEQFVGRTHRPGQEEVVKVDWNASLGVHKNAMYNAKKDARYVRDTQEQTQKLLLAEK